MLRRRSLDRFPAPSPVRRPAASLGALLALVLGACVSTPRVVPPGEIPTLQARVAADPQDEGLQRALAASLAEAGRCSEAVRVAEAFAADGRRPWPLLVRGRCLEAAGDAVEAVALYRDYLAEFEDAEGATSVRGQLLLAQERVAVSRARGADPAALPEAPESTVAVLPLQVLGSEEFQALGRGLSAQITADLLMLDRFRLVERASLQAIIDELSLAGSPMMDSTTTPSFGRVVQASRLVDGSVEVPGNETAGIQGAVILGTGEVLQTATQEGELSDLLLMEKELVFDIARQLGHTVSQAERELILQNGTLNLRAFLAYSLGLELADRGDYAAAAAQFATAYRIDGSFSGAREMLDASVGAHLMSGGGDGMVRPTSEIDALVQGVAGGGSIEGPDPLAGIVAASVNDVAPTQGEQATGGTATDATGGSSTAAVGTILQPIAPPTFFPGLIRIRVAIPGGGSDG